MDSKNMEETPFIWLQEGETDATADCGCKVLDGDQFYLCAVHKAAPKLLSACALAYIAIGEALIDNAFPEDGEPGEVKRKDMERLHEILSEAITEATKEVG